jgi:CheY-like chemotaxis protein
VTEKPGPARDHSAARVLLVDDAEDNQVALESILEGLGATLVRARSAQQALAGFRSSRVMKHYLGNYGQTRSGAKRIYAECRQRRQA